MTRVGLSTSSVYPESTAHAFGYAASVGYDAVEVMVGIDSLSQQTSAVLQLSDHHEIPISAVHAPCLLFTQRVWGTEPWGKLQRSAEMASEVGADVVVVHPPFRWQKEYAAGFVEGIAALEESTGIAFAVENMYPWRASSRRGMEMYLPGWDPSEQDYANTTIDLSHAAIARSDPVEMADPAGRPAAAHPPDRRHRLGQGRAPRPGPRLDRRRRVPRPCRALRLRRRDRGRDQHPQVREPRGARAGPARVAGVRACPLPGGGAVTEPVRRGRRPGTPDTRAAILAAAREHFAAQGFRRTTIRAVAADAGVDPALVHHYFGTKDDLFVAALELPIDPRSVIGPALAGGIDGAAERLLTVFLSVWDDPELRPGLLGVVRGALEPEGQQLIREGFLPAVILPAALALGVDQPERRMPLVASQIFGLILVRYILEVEPLASMPAADVVATIAPNIQRYFEMPLPESAVRRPQLFVVVP